MCKIPSKEETEDDIDKLCSIFDINNGCRPSDLTSTSILFKGERLSINDSSVFKLWQKQTDFQFGFVPLGEMIMPNSSGHIGVRIEDPILQHKLVKQTCLPNFLMAIESQLNIQKWKIQCAQYWDQQLL